MTSAPRSGTFLLATREEISTGTPLDEWVGLAAGTITVLEAPARGGKTTLLREIASHVSLTREVCFFGDAWPESPLPEKVLRFNPTSFSPVVQHIDEAGTFVEKPAFVVIDDAHLLRGNSGVYGGELWASLVRIAIGRRATMILAWRGDGASRTTLPAALSYGAGLHIQMVPRVRTTAPPHNAGIVVDLLIKKNTRHPAAHPLRLWLRPRHPVHPVSLT